VTAASFQTPGSNSSLGYVSNEVIALQLRHLGDTMDMFRTQVVGELQMLRSESVRTDLYAAQRKADQNELEAMKKQIERADNRKWMLWVAVATAVIALGRDLLGSVLQAGLT
jgi:hypothetical protein